MSNSSWSAPPSGVISRLVAKPLVPLGVLAVVLLAAIAAAAAFAASQAGQPAQALASFCGDLTHQKYTDAYALLSNKAQGQMNQATWVQQQQLHDQIDGQVKTCSAGQTSGGWLTFSRAGSSATVHLGRAKSYSGLIILAHQANGWKVDQIDPKLQGTDLGPLEVAESFCTALASQNFAAAYADLSSGMHASASEADFTKAYSQALSGANAKFAGCTPNVQSYTVQPPTATVQIAMQVQVTTSGGPSTVAVPFQFALVRESAGWKIDQIKASGQ